jgi:hypothetical protein
MTFIYLFTFPNVKRKIIVKCDVSALDELEIKYINEYDSMAPNGYNSVSGCNKNRYACTITRKRMSDKALKRFTNPKAIKVISDAAKRRFTDPEEKRKHSIRMKKRDTTTWRRYDDTKNLPKYMSIRRRKGVRYIIIDHPLCKYKYFGVRSRKEPEASRQSYKECYIHLIKLDIEMILNKISSIIKNMDIIHNQINTIKNIIQE